MQRETRAPSAASYDAADRLLVEVGMTCPDCRAMYGAARQAVADRERAIDERDAAQGMVLVWSLFWVVVMLSALGYVGWRVLS
jgi:type VI protein secretion system component VasF